MTLLLRLTLAMKVATEGEFLKRNSLVVRCSHLSFELCFIFITVVVYMYYILFVQGHGRFRMEDSGSNFNKKLMKTITYTYICLLLLTVSYFVRDVVSFIFPRRDLKIERNVQYWLKILVFSNSYANAFIILHNSQSKLKDVQNTTERVSRKKECKRTTFYQLVFLSVELIFLVLISLII